MQTMFIAVQVDDDYDPSDVHEQANALWNPRDEEETEAVVYTSLAALVRDHGEDDDEEEDGLRSWRVTVDTMREQYVYDVEAEDEETAKRHGLQYAANDGVTDSMRQWVKVEEV